MSNDKLKKAAVYDRWLHTLGGGEQLAFAYAEALRDLGYQTSLLTHQKIDLEAAQKKMNVNLKGITVEYLPNLVDFQLSQYTEKYDIFVSNSYLDYIPNRSEFGLLSVFFPSKINVSFYEYLKRAHIVPSLKKFFIYPSQFEGFRYDQYKKGMLHKWLGIESSITFNRDIHRLTLELYFKYLAFSCIDEVSFYLDDIVLTPANRVVNRFTNTVTYTFKFKQAMANKKLRIILPASEYSQMVSLTRLWIPDYRYFLYNIFKGFFPKWEMRLHGGPSMTRYSDVESYDKIVTLSHFSKFWIKKYWKMPSKVLYPPIDTTHFIPATKKKNLIMHVGRFFIGGHNKKQLDLIRVFKQLCDGGIKDWELHLVGSVAPGAMHYHYLDSVKEEIEGYPVFIHLDATFLELQSLLSEAKLYWHATGLDENEPIRMEHFGITTVEAMASGCVPLVINKGGQPEIVTESSGYVWNTREELLQFSKKLITHPQLLVKKSQSALERSKHFNKSRFREQLASILPKYET